MRTLRIVAAIFLSVSALALGGCQTTTSGGSVGAERKQLMLVSSQQLDQMAAQGYNKMKADATAKGTLNTDRAMLHRVQSIAARIEPQTRVFRADAPRAGASLWQKMSQASSGGRPPEFLSSHPADSSRVRQIQALLPTVMPLYAAARR